MKVNALFFFHLFGALFCILNEKANSQITKEIVCISIDQLSFYNMITSQKLI